MHNNTKRNPTFKEHNSITFLDLTVTRRHTRLEVDNTGNQTLKTQQLTFFLITP